MIKKTGRLCSETRKGPKVPEPRSGITAFRHLPTVHQEAKVSGVPGLSPVRCRTENPVSVSRRLRRRIGSTQTSRRDKAVAHSLRTTKPVLPLFLWAQPSLGRIGKGHPRAYAPINPH